MILSGDRHLGELSLSTAAIDYPLYDLTSSGFNQGAKRWREQEPNSKRVSSLPYGDHFGMVKIDWADTPTVSLQLRDEAGEIALKQTFPLSLLTPVPGAAKKMPASAKPLEIARPDGVLSPAEAMAKVGETVTVQFAVVGGRAVSGGKRILLNSDRDFKAKTNFTVVVNEAAMTAAFEGATFDTFAGKTIRATGTRDRVQRRAANPDQRRDQTRDRGEGVRRAAWR